MRAKYQLVWLLGAVLSGAVWAKTAYITDQGEFHLRSGESTRYRIIRVLPSGTAVEVLSHNENTGYSRVRLADGTQGFILSRYLQDEPAARDHLAAMQARLDELQQAPDQLASKLSRLEEQHQKLVAEHEATLKRNEQLEQELLEIRRAAANVVNIAQERAALQEDVARLTRKVGELEQENLELRNRNSQDWFLTGAAVAGGGVLAGLILPHLRWRRRRRNYWSSL